MTANGSNDQTSPGGHDHGLPANPPERPHPLAPHHRLAEFELLEVIGEGGFGIVYRAYDHSLQREVAIKEYMPSMLARRVGDNSVHVRSDRLTATFEAGRRSFINEARTLAQFSHPALVRVHRFWEENSTAYMAIQLYQGRTLRRLADEEPAKITEVWLLAMLGPLLGALETLHRSQCFHRDIAPDNIFIQQQDDRPVLLDFGAARKSIADMVDEVAVMVKSGYSPIEQYADDNTLLQGAWTDLYALGAVLYRAVTGQPPPSAVVRSVQDAYVPLAALAAGGRRDLSPAFCSAVDHALAVHSKDRTQTVAAFAEELGLVKMGDIYVSRFAAMPPATALMTPRPSARPVSQAPSVAPVERTVTPAAIAAATAAPVPLPVSVPIPAPPAPPAPSMPPAPVSAPAFAMEDEAPARPAKTASRRPGWLLVGGLVIALVAVGSWIGLRLTDRGVKPPQVATVPTPPAVAAAPEAAPPATPSVSPASSPPPLAGVEPSAVAVPPDLATSASAPVAGTAPSAGTVGMAAAPAAMPPASSATGAAGTSAVAPVAIAPTTPTAPVVALPNGSLPPLTPEAALAVTEAEDWRVAQTLNTREGYEAYLRRYRRNMHARDARNAIAELSRQAALGDNAAAAGAAATASPDATAATGTALPSATAGSTSTTAATTAPVPRDAAAPPGSGRILFNIRPWGQVFVDGVDRGVSPPLKSLSLRPGIYNVEVRNGDLDSFRQRITVQDSRSAPVVSYEFH